MQAPISVAPDSLHCNQPHFVDAGRAPGRVWAVTVVTAICMVFEITFGHITGSMALLADGWHMSTHVAALAIAGIAYWYSARLARHPGRAALFCWGTWKIEVLGSFASSLLLVGVAIAMSIEAVQRLISPAGIAFDEAMIVAVIGLVVNLVSAWLLHGAHDHHDHGHDHDHAHAHAHAHDHATDAHHQDLNLRAAYVHVLADAATSVLAIAALAAGRFLGWNWLDSAVAILGAVLITQWAVGLARDSGRVLLDAEMDAHVVEEVRAALEDAHTHVIDLHVWRVGRAAYSVSLALQTSQPQAASHYRSLLSIHEEIVHATIEVNPERAAVELAAVQ
jgi:cation diffusion facilitator family transporter